MKVERQENNPRLRLGLVEARYLTGISHQYAEAGNHAHVMQEMWQRLMDARYQSVLAHASGAEQSGLGEILRDNAHESSMIRSIACMMLSDQEETVRSSGKEMPDVAVEVPAAALEVVYRVANEDATILLREALARSDIAECAAAEHDLHRLQGVALGVRNALHPLIVEDFA